MSGPYVQYRAADGAATLILDSPHNRNALSTRLVTELRHHLAAAAADPAVRAVVLTHTGGTFCAGADLAEASAAPGSDTGASTGAATGPPAPAAARTPPLAELLRVILELPKPVVAQIDGHVRAGGMGLAGACDIVIAGPSCTFALTEARLGLAPSIISLTVLPRLTSRAAGRYFLTGEKFGPQEAMALGLVTIATDDTAEAAAAILGQLRLASPQGLAESKALTTAAILAEFGRSADRLAAQSARLFASEEALEGMNAFLQKRQPRWAR
jgi:enoyl-CoA hydratase